MEHDPRAWLWDVRRAADSIAAFVESRSFADYAADLMLRSAVERQFEIAGEAFNRLSQEVPGSRCTTARPLARDRHAHCADPWLPRGRQRDRVADHSRGSSCVA